MLKYTAIEFIHIFQRFIEFIPDKKEWNRNALRNYKPGYCLYSQLESLFNAFELGKLTDFESGDFILKMNDNDYKIIFKKLLKQSQKNHSEINFIHLKIEDRYQLVLLFKHLWEYRKTIEKLFHFNHGLIQTSGFELYGCRKVEQLNSYIKKRIYIIENILSLIISPQNKTFSKNELIEKYSYPKKEATVEDFILKDFE